MGQCAITALIVNDYLGGDIRKCHVGEFIHYFNFIDNKIIDLTSSQFDNNIGINYDDYTAKNKEQIISNPDTNMRYIKLKTKVSKYMDKINDIESNIRTCDLCLNNVEKFNGQNTISYGSNYRVLLLGEAPANNGWRKSGIAWYDINHKLLPSGKVMQKLLNDINVSLEDTMFLEAIKCYPKDRKCLNQCITNCRSFLINQLGIIEPDIILLLGNSATKAVLDIEYKNFSDVVGNDFELVINDKKIRAVPIYHPSPISPNSYKGNVAIFKNLKLNK